MGKESFEESECLNILNKSGCFGYGLNNFEQSDRPDWISKEDSVGVEVTIGSPDYICYQRNSFNDKVNGGKTQSSKSLNLQFKSIYKDFNIFEDNTETYTSGVFYNTMNVTSSIKKVIQNHLDSLNGNNPSNKGYKELKHYFIFVYIYTDLIHSEDLNDLMRELSEECARQNGICFERIYIGLSCYTNIIIRISNMYFIKNIKLLKLIY